jgi:3-hydroxymyristoyl/3-hydroxydecanoyl-(acyl carrier protein) dehydratase
MRYQFVDEIVSLALDGPPRIEVAKRFDAADDVFSGPLGPARLPESMLLELMATTGGHLVLRHLGGGRLPLVLKVPECRFERPVAPGDPLRAHATLRGVSPVADGTSVAEAETRVYCAADLVAHARIMFVCVSVPGTPDFALGGGG